MFFLKLLTSKGLFSHRTRSIKVSFEVILGEGLDTELMIGKCKVIEGIYN